jgi:hypothetical protein
VLQTILPPQLTWFEAYDKFGHDYWAGLMAACGNNVRKVARVSASNRADVYKKLERFGVPLPRRTSHGHRGNWGDLSNEEPGRAVA